MSPSILRAPTLALVAVAFVAPLTAQSVLLRLNPPVGQVSRYETTMEINMDMPGMPTGGPFMTAVMQTTQTVIGVEGDVIELTILTDSSRIETPAMPMMASQMPVQTGQTQTMKITTRGRTVSMDVAGASPEVQDLLRQLGGLNFELPENEVSPGDTWVAEMSVDVPGMPGGGAISMDMILTYTLVSVTSSGGAQIATVSYEGPIAISGDAGIGMQGNGTSSGTFVFDLTAGRINSVDTEMSMSMDVAAAGFTVQQSATTAMRLIG